MNLGLQGQSRKNEIFPVADPTAISPEDAAELLTEEGGWPVTPEMLHLDVAAGAPRNEDGTLNLVYFASWLVREMDGA